MVLRVLFVCGVIAAVRVAPVLAAVGAGDVAAAAPEHRAAVQFLIENMPDQDRANLTREFLFENVAEAFQARNATAWARAVPDELFFDAVLPYASINEHRDNWRKDFAARFGPLVKECKSASEAALLLNRTIFKLFKVAYHPTKRPKPDQSPYESIAAGYASCSGLTVLLIDACRAVGVPARFVGTPAWTTGKGDANGNHGGNHSWIEIWDGQWHVLGAIEVGPLDQTWFLGNASKADPAQAENCIYASSFKKTGVPFPLVWAPSIKWVSAENVTQSYLRRTPVKFQVLDQATGKAAETRLGLRLKGQLIADTDLQTPATLILSAGQEYDAVLARTGASDITLKFSAPEGPDRTISWTLGR